MNKFRTLTSAALVISLSASSAYAGGLAPAVEETAPIMMDAPAPTGSLGQLVVPLILLGLVAVAASASDTEGDDDAAVDSIFTDAPS